MTDFAGPGTAPRPENAEPAGDEPRAATDSGRSEPIDEPGALRASHKEGVEGQAPGTEASAAETSAPATPTSTETPIDPALADMTRQRDELQDRFLRKAAEFDNYRKRVDRERREWSDAITADVLAELLPIVDDLERALQAEAGSEIAEAYRRGVELIYQQLLDLLRKRGVKPIEAIGADFDPRYHQAVIHEQSEQHRDGEVMAELRKGYLLGDRLLRPSMVKVAKA